MRMAILLFLQQSDSSLGGVVCCAVPILLLIVIVVATMHDMKRKKEQIAKKLSSIESISNFEVGNYLAGLPGSTLAGIVLSCAVTENDFIFLTDNGLEAGLIKRDSINNVLVDTRASINKRITATRLLALGIFAVAVPKTTKSYCLMIDWDDSTGVKQNTIFELSGVELGVDALTRANKAADDLRRYTKTKIERLNVDEKKCPFCAEIIKSEAIICRYCNNNI